jgi:hypothetical protein
MRLSGSSELIISVYTDEIVFNKTLDLIVFFGSFGNDYIEQSTIIFPLQHPTEMTFTDLTSLGEPFRQYICFEGPIKNIINDISFLEIKDNRKNDNLLRYTRIFSKPLILGKTFDSFLLNSNQDYDQYVFDMNTRASLYMTLASKELSPLDSNF